MQVQESVVKTTTKSALSIDKMYAAQFQKAGTQTVQLRQQVISHASYPGQRASNSMNGSLFSTSEFGFSSKEYTNTETRVGWINVPASATLEQVQAKLAAAPKANLYRVLSNRPILTEDQDWAVRNGVGTSTMDSYADSQVIRYPKGHASEGKIALDSNGKVQYRAIFFAPQGMDDQEGRSADKTDMYVSPAIEAELNGTPSSATIVPTQGI